MLSNKEQLDLAKEWYGFEDLDFKKVEDVFYASHVGGDIGFGQDLPGRVLARWVAHLGGAAAHQDDGFVSRLLQMAESHDRHKRSHM